MSNLSSSKGPGQEPSGLRLPSNGKTIYHRPLNRARTAELSQASFAYLFGEMVSYAQHRVTGINELEQRCVPLCCLLPSPPFPIASEFKKKKRLTDISTSQPQHARPPPRPQTPRPPPLPRTAALAAPPADHHRPPPLHQTDPLDSPLRPPGGPPREERQP